MKREEIEVLNRKYKNRKDRAKIIRQHKVMDENYMLRLELKSVQRVPLNRQTSSPIDLNKRKEKFY